MLTFSGRRQDLFTLTIFPAILKACSAGTEVAGAPRYFKASCAKCGYRFDDLAHHSKGPWSVHESSKSLSPQYLAISRLTLSVPALSTSCSLLVCGWITSSNELSLSAKTGSRIRTFVISFTG